MFVPKKEAAEILGVSMPRIYQLISSKRISVDDKGNVDPDSYEKKKPFGLSETSTNEDVHVAQELVADSVTESISFLTTNFEDARTCSDDTDLVFAAYIDAETKRLYFNLFCEDDLRDEDNISCLEGKKVVFVAIPSDQIRKALKK
jgi:hypothetical protein